MTAVVLTQITAASDGNLVFGPHLFAGTFDVISLSATAHTSWIGDMCLGLNYANEPALFEAKNKGRALISSPAWSNGYILVAESLDDIANLCDARTVRKG